jgi:hypothetical protein
MSVPIQLPLDSITRNLKVTETITTNALSTNSLIVNSINLNGTTYTSNTTMKLSGFDANFQSLNGDFIVSMPAGRYSVNIGTQVLQPATVASTTYMSMVMNKQGGLTGYNKVQNVYPPNWPQGSPNFINMTTLISFSAQGSVSFDFANNLGSLPSTNFNITICAI